MQVVYDVEPFDLVRASYVRQRFAPHRHDTWAIGIVERGASRSWYRGRVDRHEPRSVIAIAPGEVHTGEADHPDGWSYRMIYPPTSVLAEAIQTEVPLPGRSFVADASLWRRFAFLHRQLERQRDTSRAAMVLQPQLHEFLRHLVRRFGPVARPQESVPSLAAAIERVRQYLDHHFAHHVTLRTLSKVAHLSPFQLIRVFKRRVGLPPHAYLSRLRIEQPKRCGSAFSDLKFRGPTAASWTKSPCAAPNSMAPRVQRVNCPL